jgi:endoribonuclease Dicer
MFLSELEELLQCKIATCPLSDEYKNQAKEKILPYPRLLDPFETPLYQKLYARFGDMDLFKSHFRGSKIASCEIGAWGSDQYWQFALGEEQQARKAEDQLNRDHHAQKGGLYVAKLDADHNLLKEATELVSSYQFSKPSTDFHEGDLSPKVLVLRLFLLAYFSRPSSHRCIVFATRRVTARLLCLIFQFPELGSPHLRPGLLTGLGASNGDLKLSSRQQIMAMKRFRTSEINCLVSLFTLHGMQILISVSLLLL